MRSRSMLGKRDHGVMSDEELDKEMVKRYGNDFDSKTSRSTPHLSLSSKAEFLKAGRD